MSDQNHGNTPMRSVQLSDGPVPGPVSPSTQQAQAEANGYPFQNPKSNPSRFTSYNYNPPDMRSPTEPMPNPFTTQPSNSTTTANDPRPTSSHSKAAHRISPPRTSSKYPPSPSPFPSNPHSAPLPGSFPHSTKSRPTSSSANSTAPGIASSSSGTTGFLPPIRGQSRLQAHLLLLNPNSTPSMTTSMLNSLSTTLPTSIEITGYTAPIPSPSAIESATDAILSTEACLRDLAKHSAPNNETIRNFDGILVACFSKHPLIDALRELYDVPVIGIMEASLYVARMLGGRFGIVATGPRSKILQDDAVRAYGLEHFYVGSEVTYLGVLELESKPREEVAKRIGVCSKKLVSNGADVILLGCAGMTELGRAAKDAVREEDGRRLVNVVDGVEAGVMVLAGLVGMSVPTSKKGVYASAREARRRRGQGWF